MLNEQDMAAGAESVARVPNTILILEDEVVLSVMLEDLVREMGASNVHVFGDADRALEFADTAPLDCAILDVHLGRKTSFGVADRLADRGIPFLFSSASSGIELDERHRHRPMLNKPFADSELRAQLTMLMRR